MKRKLLLLTLLFITFTISSQTVDSITKGVKQGMIQADKIINPPKVKIPSQINKIKPDTITVTDSFNLNTMDLVKVEVKEHYFVVTYYDPNSKNPDNPKIYFEKATPNNVIHISTGTTLFHPYYSIVTVPFKFRPKTGSTPSYSKADISNVGIYIGWGTKYDKYFYDSTTSTHKWSAGIVFGPSVEELNSENTNGQIVKSNQAYLSTGLMATYTYNKITLAVIPFGIDTGFSGTAKKWIYNGNFWWGLGLGIDADLLGF
jgi:hypothetical protein